MYDMYSLKFTLCYRLIKSLLRIRLLICLQFTSQLPHILSGATSPPLRKILDPTLVIIAFARTHFLIWCSCGTKAAIFELSRATADLSRPYIFYQGHLGRRKLDFFGLVFVSFSLVFMQMAIQGPGSAVVKKGKKWGQIGKISVSEASPADVWATLTPSQTTAIFSFFPQCGAWSQASRCHARRIQRRTRVHNQ